MLWTIIGILTAATVYALVLTYHFRPSKRYHQQ